jgi:hypothetical protein
MLKSVHKCRYLERAAVIQRIQLLRSGNLPYSASIGVPSAELRNHWTKASSKGVPPPERRRKRT